METTAVVIPDKAELERENSLIVSRANDLVVNSVESFVDAGAFLKDCADVIRKIHTHVDPVVESTNAAHKAATKLRADLLTMPTLARSVVSLKMVKWETAEKARAAEAERQARAKLQAEEDERRAALAEKALKVGDQATSEAIVQTIGTPPSRPIALPVEAQPPPKVEGVSLRDNWKARAKPGDPIGALIEAAAKNPALRVFLMIDTTALNKEAKLRKETFNVPGFEAWNDRGTAVRT